MGTVTRINDGYKIIQSCKNPALKIPRLFDYVVVDNRDGTYSAIGKMLFKGQLCPFETIRDTPEKAATDHEKKIKFRIVR